MIIVAAIVEHMGRVLLIKRSKPPFAGTLILPGGKVEAGETLEEAIDREVFEETGLKVREKHHLGYILESVYSAGRQIHLHELTLFYCHPFDFNFRDSREGRVYAYGIHDIARLKPEINPSDFRMLELGLLSPEPNFRRGMHVEERNGGYFLRAEWDLPKV